MIVEETYITQNALNALPPALIDCLWDLYFNLRKKADKIDYLNVFRLTKQRNRQIISHIQEYPKYKKKHYVKLRERNMETGKFEDVSPVEGKVYIIEYDTHITMLLASDY